MADERVDNLLLRKIFSSESKDIVNFHMLRTSQITLKIKDLPKLHDDVSVIFLSNVKSSAICWIQSTGSV